MKDKEYIGNILTCDTDGLKGINHYEFYKNYKVFYEDEGGVFFKI